LKVWILPVTLGLFLTVAVYWKYQDDMEVNKEHYIATSHNDQERLVTRLEGKLLLVYQGIRTIANLPAMRINSLQDTSLDANMLHTISDIYDNLLKNVGLSKIYFLPSRAELDAQNDQHGHNNKHHGPYLVVNPEFHFNVPLSEMSRDDSLIMSSIHEQLQFLEEKFPNFKDVRNITYPAITSDNANRGDNPSLIYTLPIYGRGGSLKGVISAIIPVNQFSKILEPSANILVHKNHQFIIAPPSAGKWNNAMQWVEKGVPHPELFYSEVLAVYAPDLSGEWALWAARPDSEYWSRGDVVSARNFMYAGTVFSVLLTAGLIFFVKMTKRQQQMIKQKNIELEIKVYERTRELKKALSASEESAQALSESEEKNRSVITNAVDGIVTIDETGIITSFNPAAENMFGYKASEVIGSKVEVLMPEPYHSEHQSFIDNHISTGEKRVIGIGPREVTAMRKDGSIFPLDLAIGEMHTGGQRQFLAMVRDITERKRAQEALQQEKEEQVALIKQLQSAQDQLMQSEKMASIGQLAAGVAHEINNPVGYINSNIGSLDQYVKDLFSVLGAYEMADPVLATDAATHKQIQDLKKKVDLNFLKEDIVQLMKESQEGVRRVKQIVQDLKDFSHVDEAEWQWADLHKGLDSTLNIVHNEIKYKAEVIKEYGNLPEVECIHSQINQVFLNLFVNASQAIEERGVITIRTGVDDEEVWVEISDTGKGIEEDKLARIFDPFYTTKPVGKGTGLGLSLSYGIINKHNGRIEVESKVGKGTTFRIYLPVKQNVDIPELLSGTEPADKISDLVSS